MTNIIVTTTNNVEEYVTVEYFDPVTSSVVLGTSIISDLFASISDFTGGRSTTYQQKLQEMNRISIEQIKEEARKVGANCILGLKSQINEISGKGMQMFMINAIGTAARIERISDYTNRIEREMLEQEKNQKIQTAKLEQYKTMEDLLGDPEIVTQANELKRIYGETVYKDFLLEKLEKK